jgi:Undecaprenyl-phosphate galactose phosphotransferase WbaP
MPTQDLSSEMLEAVDLPNISVGLPSFAEAFDPLPAVFESPTRSLLALSHALNSAHVASRSARRFESSRADQTQASYLAACFKRALDFIGALIILVLLTPVLVLCAFLVASSSAGPLLFRHKRLGRNGREFFVWKFRTMCTNPDETLSNYLQQNPEAMREWLDTQKLTNDPRVTRSGQFMRRFSLDELPQLWNVLRGDMSLIGPRPIVANEVSRYGDAIEAYYTVRPGMTGLWQVSGRSNTTYSERVNLDRQYAEQWSLFLDFSIIVRTFRVVLSGQGAY